MPVIILIGLVVHCYTAHSQPAISIEHPFLGIPELDSISTDWFIDSSDSMDFGFTHPVDSKTLMLAPSDFRLVVLNAEPPLFTVFKVGPSAVLDYSDIFRSGEQPLNGRIATRMCLMSSTSYFNAERDCVAVAFKEGTTIGIYKFDKWKNTLSLADTLTSNEITCPLGIFWSQSQFYVSEAVNQAVFCIGRDGSTLERYGERGLVNGYASLGNVTGFTALNATHLFVSDGINERIDRLDIVSGGTTIHFHSSALALDDDTLGMTTHEVVYLPGSRLVGLNRNLQRLDVWSIADSMHLSSRVEVWSGNSNLPMVHIAETMGRLVVMSLDDRGWNISSRLVQGAVLTDPIEYGRDHWRLTDSPVFVTDSVIIGENDTLIIDAGVEILFDYGASILVDGELLESTDWNRMLYICTRWIRARAGPGSQSCVAPCD